MIKDRDAPYMMFMISGFSVVHSASTAVKLYWSNYSKILAGNGIIVEFAKLLIR